MAQAGTILNFRWPLMRAPPPPTSLLRVPITPGSKKKSVSKKPPDQKKVSDKTPGCPGHSSTLNERGEGGAHYSRSEVKYCPWRLSILRIYLTSKLVRMTYMTFPFVILLPCTSRPPEASIVLNIASLLFGWLR